MDFTLFNSSYGLGLPLPCATSWPRCYSSCESFNLCDFG
jgi:hypothetical protein